jgi:hemerythrin-like metal-binding protein
MRLVDEAQIRCDLVQLFFSCTLIQMRPSNGGQEEAMQWNSTFSIGVEKIDGQHKRLFELATLLEQELSGQQAAKSVGKALKFLVDYTIYHFKDEESLMAQINYPELDAHQALHKQLIEKVRAILLDVRAGRLPTVADLTSFLFQWIVEHIEQEDKKVGHAIQALSHRSASSDTPADILRQSATHLIKANLTKIQMLRKKSLINDIDAQAYKQNLVDKFIGNFTPTSMIEVIEEYEGIKALCDAGLMTEAEMEAIRPRFAEKIDLKGLLADDNTVELSLAHLDLLVGEKLIEAAACDRYKKRLLRKSH